MSCKKQETSWKDIRTPSYPAFSAEKPRHADVAIIGAGITGITAAYLLAKAGKKVVVLEKDWIGSYATGMTTAFLTQSIDTDSTDLMEIYGKSKAQDILDSHMAAINLTERIIAEEGISCDFKRCKNILFASSEKDARALEEEYEANKKLGLAVSLNKTKNLGFEHHGYLEFEHQAKFHPLKYLHALAKKCEDMGVEIYENSEVKDIALSDTKDSVIAKTEKGEVRADWAIAATYKPFGKPLALFFKKAVYSSYIIEGTIPAGVIPEATYEDTDNPYHYFRIDPIAHDEMGKDKSKTQRLDRIIIGGEDHRADLKIDHDKNFKALDDFRKNTFKSIPFTETKRWHGPIIEPSDGLPLIGPAHEHERILYATGFSGNGMTYSMIAATILSEMCLGRKHHWFPIYDAARFPTANSLFTKAKDYIQELIYGALHNSIKYSKDKDGKKE